MNKENVLLSIPRKILVFDDFYFDVLSDEKHTNESHGMCPSIEYTYTCTINKWVKDIIIGDKILFHNNNDSENRQIIDNYEDEFHVVVVTKEIPMGYNYRPLDLPKQEIGYDSCNNCKFNRDEKQICSVQNEKVEWYCICDKHYNFMLSEHDEVIFNHMRKEAKGELK